MLIVLVCRTKRLWHLKEEKSINIYMREDIIMFCEELRAYKSPLFTFSRRKGLISGAEMKNYVNATGCSSW